MQGKALVIVLGAVLLGADRGKAQHLWWDISKLDDATCVYGEITVLATHHPIYYCGANWHPGEPAGGYCGIQHNGPKERRAIFSIWDTSPALHPQVIQADSRTVFNRFGGEGEGAHTHMPWEWQVGDTFQFFVQKRPGKVPGTSDARFHVYDRAAKKWLHSATITSPNGDSKSAKSVATIGGGGLASFLENFGGTERHVPKLALYRLWLGTGADSMKCLTQAQGDGIWGQLHDCFFLAEGGSKELEAMFAQLKERYGVPVFGQEGRKLAPISERPLPATLIKQLQDLPEASRVRDRK